MIERIIVAVEGKAQYHLIYIFKCRDIMDGMLGLGEFVVEFGRKDGAEFLIHYSHLVQIHYCSVWETELRNGRAVAVSRLSREALSTGLEIR